MTEHNIVSVSGGKDSTALLLLALEAGAENMQAVFADTGNEHPQTYEYLSYLEQATGVTIRRVVADFSKQIERKRRFVAEKWPAMLMQGKPGSDGYWTCARNMEGVAADEGSVLIDPPPPADVWSRHRFGDWAWTPATAVVPGMSGDEAGEFVANALAVLQPTGNPFLDLCVWKGRFPSSQVAFCSEELKRLPINNQVQEPLLSAGDDVVSWQGVRADESLRRSLLTMREHKSTHESGAELWNYRPILQWDVEQVFAMHRKHGIRPNPLYAQGMGRVGCMPCINCRKDELLEISQRFPDQVDKIRRWEAIVGQASKQGSATFFTSDERGHGIDELVEWSQTARGGHQFDFLRQQEGPACTSIYGLCE